eukprot:UN3007
MQSTRIKLAATRIPERKDDGRNSMHQRHTSVRPAPMPSHDGLTRQEMITEQAAGRQAGRPSAKC